MKYYTYMWLREDGTPYYIGKGSGNRAYTRRRVGNAPLERVVVTYYESEQQAFQEEIRLIAHYGRVDLGTGCLRNLTDGGENPPNHKGKKHGPEWGAKRSAALKGRINGPQSSETKEKRRKAMLGRTFSPESVVVTFRTKDINTEQEILLSMQDQFHSWNNSEADKYLIEWLANLIRKFEEHEFREWFKVDGFCVYEPHPEFKEATL